MAPPLRRDDPPARPHSGCPSRLLHVPRGASIAWAGVAERGKHVSNPYTIQFYYARDAEHVVQVSGHPEHA